MEAHHTMEAHTYEPRTSDIEVGLQDMSDLQHDLQLAWSYLLQRVALTP